MIAPRWLRLFNAREVNQLLVGGEGGGLDVADMRAHARYSGGYRPDSPTVKLFWKVRPSDVEPKIRCQDRILRMSIDTRAHARYSGG